MDSTERPAGRGCRPGGTVADAENGSAVLGTASDTGDVGVRGTTLDHAILVDAAKPGVRICLRD